MVSDQDLLDAVREFISPENCPVATSDDVAKRVDVKRETVRQRLLRLAADDELRTRKLGRSRVFWLPDALGSGGGAPTEFVDEEPDLEPRLDEPDDEPERADQEQALAELEPPGLSEEVVEQRRAAVADALDALDEAGADGLEKSALLEAIDGTAGYDTGDSLWQNWLYDALSELDRKGVLNRPERGSPGWKLAP